MLRRSGTAVFGTFAALCLPLRAASVFDHPRALCSALEPLGIRTSAWLPMGQNPAGMAGGVFIPYACEFSTSPAFGTGLPAILPKPELGQFFFRVSGDRPDHADTISIAVTVSVKSAKPKALEQALAAAKSLFQAMQQRPPTGLYHAMQNEQHFVWRGPAWILSFTAEYSDSGRTQHLWLRLREVRPVSPTSIHGN